jgi:V8-like Glu-specific endopeptidase
MLAGLVSVPMPASAMVVSGIRGDVDGNGVVNNTDVTKLNAILNNTWYPTYLNGADVNNDGVISIQDVDELSYRMVNSLGYTTFTNALPTSMVGSDDDGDTYEIYDFSGTDGGLNYENFVDDYQIITLPPTGSPGTNPTLWGNPSYYPDDRYQTQDQSIVQIWHGYMPEGTGTIVGPHTILTALHCVPENELEFKNNVFTNKNLSVRINSWNSSGNSINIVDVEDIDVMEVHIPQGARTYNPHSTTNITNWELDYALLVVEEDLTEYGIVDLGIALNSLIGKTIYAAGYPGLDFLPVGGTPNRLYTDWGNVLSFGYYTNETLYNSATSTSPSNASLIATSCYLNKGHSGGPFYIYSNYVDKIQVGVFSCFLGDNGSLLTPYSNGNPVYSYGPKVTPQIYNFVNNNPKAYLYEV